MKKFAIVLLALGIVVFGQTLNFADPPQGKTDERNIRDQAIVRLRQIFTGQGNFMGWWSGGGEPNKSCLPRVPEG